MQHVCFCSDIIMFGFLRVFLFGNGTHCIVAAFRIWSRWWLLNTIELSSTSILSDWLGRRGYIGTLAISCYVWLFCKKTSQKCEKLFQVRNEWIQLECLDAGWKKYISIYIYIWCERSSKDPYFELQGCSSRSWGKSPWSLLDRRLETGASETGEWLHPSQVGHRDPTYPGWVQTDAGWEKFPKDIRTYIYIYIHTYSFIFTYVHMIYHNFFSFQVVFQGVHSKQRDHSSRTFLKWPQQRNPRNPRSDKAMFSEVENFPKALATFFIRWILIPF